MPKIAIIDYDMGNLHSARKGIEKAGAATVITDSVEDLERADAIVLPGVGAFDPAMQHLRQHHLVEPIRRIIDSGKPFLGICLGLQVLFEGSEEGEEAGLGIFPGKVRRFRAEPGITIPHMGWNSLELTQPNLPIWQHLPSNPYLYFVHSFYVEPADPSLSAAMITHGSQCVTAAIACDNVVAVQFHPEKSSDNGLQFLANFVGSLTQPEAMVVSSTLS